ncbi:uncharacterized protein LOC123547811 isoform X2 [Mercenaria mercenaria]|uniref:uncharacterized protein LOC123547811 isoform X2 n=1 Tax=Mercenaria mercenaria TaxID=6596 RepID=UPI00234FA2A2|nr:uncharacterized protein LOC123547811 isoform X2 [Mercenaria mercenaria]
MASKDVKYHLKNDTSGPYQIIKAGKFWLLRIRGKTKRISFLENAKDVSITENILVADDEIFEIDEDEDGQISFERVEELSYKSKDSKPHLKMKVKDGQDNSIFNENFGECRKIGATRVGEFALPLYDETSENLSINKLTIHDNRKNRKEKHLADSEFIREKSDRSGKDPIEKKKVQLKTDAKRTSSLDYCSDRDDNLDKGHEEYISLENRSTEVDSTKKVETKHSALTKLQAVNSGKTVTKIKEKIQIDRMAWEVISTRHFSELEQLKTNFDEFRYDYETIIVTATGTSDVLESRLKELRKLIERFNNKEYGELCWVNVRVSQDVFALCNEIESLVGYECCMYEPRTQKVITYCNTYEDILRAKHLLGLKTGMIKPIANSRRRKRIE